MNPTLPQLGGRQVERSCSLLSVWAQKVAYIYFPLRASISSSIDILLSRDNAQVVTMYVARAVDTRQAETMTAGRGRCRKRKRRRKSNCWVVQGTVSVKTGQEETVGPQYSALHYIASHPHPGWTPQGQWAHAPLLLTCWDWSCWSQYRGISRVGFSWEALSLWEEFRGEHFRDETDPLTGTLAGGASSWWEAL